MSSSLNGTGLTFSTGATLNSPPVTSVATGNGLQGGTITTTGTISVAAPTQNTVGSYVLGYMSNATGGALTYTFGNNYSVGTGAQQVQVLGLAQSCGATYFISSNALSGTWKFMGASATLNSAYTNYCGLFVRVA